MTWPRININYNESDTGIRLLVQARPYGRIASIALDADQAHVLLRELNEALDGSETLPPRVVTRWPRIEVGFDATHKSVALWLKSHPLGRRGPIFCTDDGARELIATWHRAIDARDYLRNNIAAIRDADPDDFKH